MEVEVVEEELEVEELSLSRAAGTRRGTGGATGGGDPGVSVR